MEGSLNETPVEPHSLLPCPFCGSESELIISKGDYGTDYRVECNKCCGQVTGSVSEDLVIEGWNRRHTDVVASPEPFRITGPGKYRTSGGFTVEITWVDKALFGYHWAGKVVVKTDDAFYSLWTASGNYWSSGTASQYDIVSRLPDESPVQEPPIEPVEDGTCGQLLPREYPDDWVEITDPGHVLRKGVDYIGFSNCEHRMKVDRSEGQTKMDGALTRCRRRDLPKPPVPEPDIVSECVESCLSCGCDKPKGQLCQWCESSTARVEIYPSDDDKFRLAVNGLEAGDAIPLDGNHEWFRRRLGFAIRTACERSYREGVRHQQEVLRNALGIEPH